MNILEEIKEHKLREVAERKSLSPVRTLEQSVYYELPRTSLRDRLLDDNSYGIIAEFKRRSPSRGTINQDAKPETICQGYAEAGASALSVLTDEKYFGGSAEDLTTVRELNDRPILRKDFIIDEYQIVEARSMGADVILLIAEMLSKIEIKQLTQFAVSLELEVLFELHDETQLDKLNDDIHLVGINNRDLRTFDIKLESAIRLASLIPDNFVKVAESGIDDPSTVIELRKIGYNGFLIGDYFMRQADPVLACENFIQAISSQEIEKA